AGSGDAHVSLVRTDGSVAYDVAVPTIRNVFVGQYLEDGTAEILGLDSTGNLDLVALSPSGSVQWNAPIVTGTTTSTIASMTAVIDNTNSFVTLTFGAQQSARGAEVIKVDRGSGAI